MQTWAVVIKHPGRDWESDVRIDIYETSNEATELDVKRTAYQNMLGPFEVLFVTQKINLTKKLIP